MPSQAKGKQFIEAPLDRIAELLRTALARHNFRIELVNDELCELTASMTKTERIRTTNWNYDFRVVCNWEPVDDGVLVSIEVNELKNQGTEKCSAIWKDLSAVLVEKAATLKRLKEIKAPASKYGSARFATQLDIEGAGLLADEEGTKSGRRFVIGPGSPGRLMSLPTEFTNMHSLICGPTGCGKTTSLFIPNLIERTNASAIVTEATAGSEMPDLFLKTARWRQNAGHRIYYFNPDDMSSDRINPIDTVRGVDDAQALARLIIDNTTGKNFGGDPFWPDSERQLLSVLIAHAKAIKSHLGFVRELLNEGPDNLTGIIKESPSAWAREQYRGFSNTAQEGVKRGVFSGLMTRLSLWTNPKIVALTEKTDMDLDALPSRLFTFYLAVPAHRPHMKPLAAMIFNYFLSLAQDRGFAHPLFLSLDEFTNFGVINAIASNLTIIRHRGIPAMIGIQDYIQLEEAYGRNDAQLLFNQPGFKAFYRPRDLKTAKQISDMLGRQTVVERKVTSSGQIVEQERGRELLDPSELLALDSSKYIAFTPVTPPILVERFTWRDYEKETAEPPLPRLEIEVDDQVVKACAEVKKEPDWMKKGRTSAKKEGNNQVSDIENRAGANPENKAGKPDASERSEDQSQAPSEAKPPKSKIDEDWIRQSALSVEPEVKHEPLADKDSKARPKHPPEATPGSVSTPVPEQKKERSKEVGAAQAPVSASVDEEKELLEAILGPENLGKAMATSPRGLKANESVKQAENELLGQPLVESKREEASRMAAQSLEGPLESAVVERVEDGTGAEVVEGKQAVTEASAEMDEEVAGRERAIVKKRGRKRKIEIEDEEEDK